MKESKFKGTLSRCKVESLVNPLRDKEPTKAWLQELKEVLSYFDVQKQKLCQLTADSNKCNAFGRRYSDRCFSQIIDNFISGRGSRTWTANAQKTVNDHLDVLVDYLSKPVDSFEASAETLNNTIAKTSEIIGKSQTTSIKDNLESTTMSLRERLEKERAEGKWPSVDERIKEKTKNVSKDLITGHIDIPELIKAIDEVSETNKVHVKRVRKNKKYKKHRKSNNIYITINIGR